MWAFFENCREKVIIKPSVCLWFQDLHPTWNPVSIFTRLRIWLRTWIMILLVITSNIVIINLWGLNLSESLKRHRGCTNRKELLNQDDTPCVMRPKSGFEQSNFKVSRETRTSKFCSVLFPVDHSLRLLNVLKTFLRHMIKKLRHSLPKYKRVRPVKCYRWGLPLASLVKCLWRRVDFHCPERWNGWRTANMAVCFDQYVHFSTGNLIERFVY